jgi:hypothetical protein
MWFQSNAQDSEDTKYLKLLGQVVASRPAHTLWRFYCPGCVGEHCTTVLHSAAAILRISG